MIGAFAKILALVPARALGALGAGIGRAAWLVDKRHRAIARRNLARAFPELGWHARERIGREAFAELGRSVMELAHVYTKPKDWLMARIDLVGHGRVIEALTARRGAILCAAHHGNWELGALAFSMLGWPIHIPYRPLNQRQLDAWVLAARTRFGARFHPRDGAARALLKALREGEAVALMVDQHITGEPVPFFGHLALTTTLPALLHQRTGAPLFGVMLMRNGKSFRFRLVFWPIEAPKGASPVEIMRIVSDEFARRIRKKPEDWLWAHQRWAWIERMSPEAAEAVHGIP